MMKNTTLPFFSSSTDAKQSESEMLSPMATPIDKAIPQGLPSTDQTSKEIVFITGDTPDWQTLAQGVRAGVEVVILDPSKDGLAAMAEALQGRNQLSAIHVVSHGAKGALSLGALMLTSDNLDANADNLIAIGRSLMEGGDLLLYGCDVAAGGADNQFLQDLAAATGADAAASIDPTGAIAKGGDWVLESVVGEIHTGSPFSSNSMAVYSSLLALGTLDFSSDAGGLGPTVNDGEGNSQDIAGIQYEILATAVDGTTPTNNDWYYQTDVFGDLSNHDGISTSMFDPVVVIKSVGQVPFSFNGISVADFSQAQTQVTIEGFRNGVSTGVPVTLSIGGAHYATFNTTHLTPSKFQYVDEVRITNPNNINWEGDDYGNVNTLVFDDIVFGEPVFPAPTVTSVSATTPNDTYNVGDTISISVTFDSNVTVTGIPTLALNSGGTATYDSGSGGTTLTFIYTVGAGHTAADLDFSATNSLALAGGTIKNGSGTDATLTLPAVGGGSSLGGQKAIVIDGVVPTVSSIVRADTTPTTASSVNYTVTFNESVTGVDTSDFQITETGTASGSIASISGSGSTYTVTVNGITGDGNLRLDLKSSGTGIADAATNAIATGYTAGETYAIDNTGPAISSVSASTANGTYKVGDVIAVTVTFNDTVTVTGTPTLALNSGGTASYASGSGTNTLTFNYTVGAGDAAADLDYSATNSLALAGGTIKDAVGNDATLTLPTVGGGSSLGGQKAIVIDGVAPALGAATVPSDSTYIVGQHLDFTVSYNEAVTVNTGGGTPRIALTLDTGGTVYASYDSGSGTNTLTFRYTVGAGTLDSNGITADNSITLNGGTIKDAAGNNAATTGIAFGATTAVLVDGVAPSVSSIARANATPTNASSVDYTVSFAENVSGVDTGDFALTASGTAAGTIASVTPVNGSTYTVTVNTLSGDGTLRLDLNAGSTGITDTAGNAIGGGYTSGQLYTLDKTAPAVTSVGVPANATYGVGQNLDFTVNFGENVTVNTGGGTPTIGLTLNTGGTVQAGYVSGSGTSALVFRYTVALGNVDADGVALAGTIAANGGTIKDAVGNDAALTLNSVGSTAAVLVNGMAPTVTSVSVPANSTYTAGQHLDFVVNFDESVAVTGTPYLELTLDTGGTVQAQYSGGTGSTALTFRYTVASGNADGNGVATAAALTLNGGTIKNSVGNNAVLTLNSVASTAGVLVDALAPTVAAVQVPANGIYKTGDNLDFTVQMSEAVTVDTTGGVPRVSLTLNTGGTVYATYLSGSGSSNLVFRYTVASGNVDTDGITVGALASNGGTLRDAAGNDATLTLNSVGSTASVKIDTVAPTLNTATFSVAENAANGTVVGTASGSDDTTLSYSLTDDASGRFAINAGTAQITVANGSQLNFEGTASHQVTVRATDAAGNQTDTAFTINLTNVNDAPVVAANTGTTLTAGATQVITTAMLGVTDEDHAAAALTYTVQTLPANGGLKLNGVALAVNDTFTQADIDGGKLSYLNGGTIGADSFSFTVSDGAGGSIASTSFALTVNAASGGGGGGGPTLPTPSTVDGVSVQQQTTTNADGTVSQTIVIPVVTSTRTESVGNNTVADIPLVSTGTGTTLLTAQIPTGVGLQVTGSTAPKAVGSSLTDLIREIQAHTTDGSADQNLLTAGGSGFLSGLPSTSTLLVQTIVPTVASDAEAPSKPLVIAGAERTGDEPMTALVIDARTLPSSSVLQLDNVEFAAIIGAVRVVGGAGSQNVWGDNGAQHIVLGADDDVLHGGAGNDTVGSAGGNDQIFGDEGNDTVFGGEGNDFIDGGTGTDTLELSGSGRAAYSLRVQNGNVVFTQRDSGTDGIDTVGGVETIRFTDTQPDLGAEATITRLYDAVFNRAPGQAEKQFWLAANTNGVSLHDVAANFIASTEARQLHGELSNAQYIDKLYTFALDREADAAGRAYWLGQLENGAIDRAGVLLSFANSTEKLGSEAATPAVLDFNLSEAASLVRLYDTLLGRRPDEGGINHWLQANEGGVLLQDIAYSFVVSTEAQQRHGALSNHAYVDMLYKTALNRAGSVEEVASWTYQLDTGAMHRGDVLLGFADSAEKIGLVGVINTSIETV